jgi:CBS domain-containing protein
MKHHGFPVLDATGRVIGMLTRRDLEGGAGPGGDGAETTVGELIRRPVIFVRDVAPLREVVEKMVHEDVGRLPVVDADGVLRGIVTRSDVLRAYGRAFAEDRVSA